MLSWIDPNGIPRTLHGQCVDLSEGGIRIRLPNPLDIHTYVSIKFPLADLYGSASVRSCVSDRMSFIAGLQFTGGMKLSPPITEAAAAGVQFQKFRYDASLTRTR